MRAQTPGSKSAASPDRAERGPVSKAEPDQVLRHLRVLIVDGHRLFREGLCALLHRHPELHVVDDVGTAAEAVAKALSTKPDVVVTAFVLRDGTRGAVVRELRTVCPEIPVVVLSGGDAEEALSQALEEGAAGFLLRDATADLVVKAIQAVCAGEIWVQREAMKQVFGKRRDQRPSTNKGPTTLSPRESEVLRLMADGATTTEIAGRLFISPSTVRVHIMGIFRKLQVRNRIEAVRKALLDGLVAL